MQEIAGANHYNESIPEYNIPDEELDINGDHNGTIQDELSVNDDEVSSNENDEPGNMYSNDIELTNNVMSDEGEQNEYNDEGEQNEYNIENDMDERYGLRTSNYNLRPRKERNYDHLFVNDSMPLNTPQMSMKQGIALFGEDGIVAVKKELFQLYERKVMIPEMASTLSIQDKRKALGYLMFLKRKRCGKIKARGCADGRKQRLYITKEDAASPTVSNEAVFITAMIDALEDREVAVADLPGAFMQADMDTLVHVRFVGKMVELLLEIDRPLYEPYVTCERGEKVLYVRLLKALYGTIRAARLFYE